MHLQSFCNPLKHKNKLFSLIILLSLSILTLKLYSIINYFINDKVINSTVIAERLSKISELSTIKYNYSNVLGIKGIKKFKDYPIPFTEKSFLIKYSGYIKAGVDLKDLDVLINGKKITITLKKARIIDHVISSEDLFIYDEKSSMFNKLRMQDMINELNNEKNKIENDLIKKKFLDEANVNAKLLLQAILLDMGFDDVIIIFK